MSSLHYYFSRELCLAINRNLIMVPSTPTGLFSYHLKEIRRLMVQKLSARDPRISIFLVLHP